MFFSNDLNARLPETNFPIISISENVIICTFLRNLKIVLEQFVKKRFCSYSQLQHIQNMFIGISISFLVVTPLRTIFLRNIKSHVSNSLNYQLVGKL